jgi:hypothetical protein
MIDLLVAALLSECVYKQLCELGQPQLDFTAVNGAPALLRVDNC